MRQNKYFHPVMKNVLFLQHLAYLFYDWIDKDAGVNGTLVRNMSINRKYISVKSLTCKNVRCKTANLEIQMYWCFLLYLVAWLPTFATNGKELEDEKKKNWEKKADRMCVCVWVGVWVCVWVWVWVCVYKAKDSWADQPII